MRENSTKYTHRFLARFVIEAETPIAVGSGERDAMTDALVARDVNGMPYIPAASIAGVFRGQLSSDVAKFFGWQEGSQGTGSEIIFTEARILDSKGNVVDGLKPNVADDPLLAHYSYLPIRQHVRITSGGVADNAGKFDEQVVYAGTRFCFEIEMVSDGTNMESFDELLRAVSSYSFRVGGGTRSGFGKVTVVDFRKCVLDLMNDSDLSKYINKSSALDSDFWDNVQNQTYPVCADSNWTEYVLDLVPRDFYLFGSGYGDDEADMTPVREQRVVWNNGIGRLGEGMVLVPAASVKGALRHRVAYHWNRNNGFWIGDERAETGNSNEAVRILFGYENQNEKVQKRGNILFSDVVMTEAVDAQVIQHVSIDRFTGGAVNGALFQEKVVYDSRRNRNYKLVLLVSNSALADIRVKTAFEDALRDLCRGLLPLGGGVNRGNGIFNGKAFCNGKEI